IEIKARTFVKTSSGYLVRIKAINKGGSSAAALAVEGTLTDQGQTLENSEMTFDYVPAHSTKEGGLFFDHDPETFELKLRVLGYQEP
ncbi:hypothetical protein, partial [Mycobacterium tuberculosis]